MFRRFYVQKVLCSENICLKGSMFRRFYIQEVLCSEGSMFRRSYIQKVLCSEGPLFRYIEKVLCSENSLFYVGKILHFSVSGELQCKITNHRLSFNNNNFREILEFANFFSLGKLKPREYYQIYIISEFKST